MARKILLTHKRAPGDTLVLTALVRDVALTYPGEFEIGVNTSGKDFWQHNPYVSKVSAGKDVDQYTIDYGRGLRDQNQETIHFLPYFHRVFDRRYGTQVEVHRPYPDVHFGPTEHEPILGGRYWVIVAGGKSDFPVKVWETAHAQAAVNALRRFGISFVQLGSTDKGHWHPPIDGALNMVGKTNLRDVMRIVRDADGVICGITMMMHLAAALQRPCVCVAGGREAWWWEAYVHENRGLICPERLKMPHRYLHTIGQLECCRWRGCWKNKVTQINDDKSVCLQPVATPGQIVPRCLHMISPDIVVNNVLAYYYAGLLPPIPGTEIEEHCAQIARTANESIHRQPAADGGGSDRDSAERRRAGDHQNRPTANRLLACLANTGGSGPAVAACG